jgi:hypothetical protein
MNKKNLKKLLLKNHNRFLKIHQEFNDIDLDEYFGQLAKSKGFKKKYNKEKIIFDINEIEYFDNIDAILLENKIFNKETIEAIKQEFDEGRINSSYEHCHNYFDYHDELGQGVDNFENLFYHKKGSKINDYDFECDNYKSWIELEIDANNKLSMLDYWNNFGAIKAAIHAKEQGLRFYFEGGRTLPEAVAYQFDILKETIEEFNQFRHDFDKRLEAMKQAVEYLNEDLKYMHKNQLEQDILNYIEENSLIITGDIEKIKFDYVAKIEDGQAITNKGAIVPIEDAKRVLKRFLEGLEVVGEKIGVFTVNKVFDIKETVFLRIGCHLIKIDNELKQQLN